MLRCSGCLLAALEPWACVSRWIFGAGGGALSKEPAKAGRRKNNRAPRAVWDGWARREKRTGGRGPRRDAPPILGGVLPWGCIAALQPLLGVSRSGSSCPRLRVVSPRVSCVVTKSEILSGSRSSAAGCLAAGWLWGCPGTGGAGGSVPLLFGALRWDSAAFGTFSPITFTPRSLSPVPPAVEMQNKGSRARSSGALRGGRGAQAVLWWAQGGWRSWAGVGASGGCGATGEL